MISLKYQKFVKRDSIPINSSDTCILKKREVPQYLPILKKISMKKHPHQLAFDKKIIFSLKALWTESS